MSGAARPGIIGEMARNKFLMSRKNLKKVTMLKDFTNMEETDDGKDGIKSGCATVVQSDFETVV